MLLTRNTATSLVGALAVTLALTACSDTGDAGAEPGATGAGESSVEIPEVSVGALTFADVAPLYVAIEEGFFADEGLTVSIKETAGGAAQVPALISGDVSFTYASYVAVFQAGTQGIPLRVVRDNNRNSPQGIHVPPNSAIETMKDLEGATIAINALASIQELTVKAVLDANGVDLDAITLVELPPPDQLAAMERGDVDAAFLVEPFLTIGTNDGYREIMNAWQGPTEDFPIAGWITTEQFAAENPNAVEAFNRGIDRAVEMIHEDPQVMAEIIPTYSEIPADVAAQLAEVSGPLLIEHSQVEGLQQVADLMAEWDLLNEPLDPDAFIFEGR